MNCPISQVSIKGDQGCEIAIPALLQDTRPQQCLEHVYQGDDQNAADSKIYIHAELNAEQDCIVRRGEQGEEERKARYEEIQNELEKVTGLTGYCEKCGDQANVFQEEDMKI